MSIEILGVPPPEPEQFELPPEYTGAFAEAKKMLNYVLEAAMDTEIELPPRQYVTAGQAVYDCEQVAATMATVTSGLPGSSVPGQVGLSGTCPPGWQLIVELAVVRCCPQPTDDGDPPSAQQLTDFAKVQGGDTHILMTAGDSRAAERFGNVTVLISYPPPSGGIAATIARYTVAIST